MRPAEGRKLALGILGVDAAFDGVSPLGQVLLAEGQVRPGRDQDLLADEIDAGHELGDGMFDLEPGVDLEEIEAAVLVEQELDRAGVVVAGRAHGPDGRLAHLAPEPGVEGRGRRLLEDLLVAPLDRAFPLEQVDGVAAIVGQDLELDVARLFDEFLEIDRIVAEGRFRLPPAGFEGRLEAFRRPRRAASPSARRRPKP